MLSVDDKRVGYAHCSADAANVQQGIRVYEQEAIFAMIRMIGDILRVLVF